MRREILVYCIMFSLLGITRVHSNDDIPICVEADQFVMNLKEDIFALNKDKDKRVNRKIRRNKRNYLNLACVTDEAERQDFESKNPSYEWNHPYISEEQISPEW